MNRLRIVCIVLCAVFVLCAGGCGADEKPVRRSSSGAAQTEPLPSSAEVEKADTAKPSEKAEDVSVSETQAAEEQTEFVWHTGLTSTDVAEVLEFYKLAAALNDENKYTKKLELVTLNGGEGKGASHTSWFESLSKKALAKNSRSGDVLPGDYKAILPSDWQSASAVSDGTYTTLHVQVVPQTDDADGKRYEGPVGRSLTVLDGIRTAEKTLPHMSADLDNGKIYLEYRDPTIIVKVDNRTGKFVPGACKWSYRVHVSIPSLEAKIYAFKLHLKNAGGEVDYTVTY